MINSRHQIGEASIDRADACRFLDAVEPEARAPKRDSRDQRPVLKLLMPV
jgi:hypothetical protein